ncbi:MAG TPA: valine--tRNA ligase [Candidatus Paceibacterota bacterium]|nr:valine--tRNA ligase [Candidatus Paceibacterota bacterium]
MAENADESKIPEQFLKAYAPQEHEAAIYQAWEESGYFDPDNLPGERPETFSMVLPPPNVTGTLHMGHASMLAIEDAFVRFERMRGKKTLWLPGTDSAAIATQAKVEKQLEKEGTNRGELGREAFLTRVNAFAHESQATILGQTKAMGSSLDWSRLAYTLDDARTRAVSTAFVRMYEAGLIYRGDRIVNWDPKGQTVISDDEIVHEERTATLYTFRYAKDFPIPISTTRPETKVGDTAVAVNPDDERYQRYIGQEFDLTFCDVPLHIKVVADAGVDPAFGTGALGVTPAHSHIDWEIAEKNGLPRPSVINEYAKMTVEGRLSGLKVGAAREAVVAWLAEEGLLEKQEDIAQNVATAERTGGIIEPMPKLQWFIDVTKPFVIPHSAIPGIESGATVTLKQLMRAAVESKAVRIFPDNFDTTYYHWIDNLRPWCISRQIWFGHRIPVWYRGEERYCGTEAPEGDGWEQDPDTLDTWFSSGLWTFSTLGWPDATPDLEAFHPTSMLETGYDILFFWVARMILMSAFHLGTVPFRTVYLHGLVRDEKGRKMSKSLGNIIDPLTMIEKYGADATRLSLLIQNTPGTDLKLAEARVKGYKNFANKIWNITRFVLTSVAGADLAAAPAYTADDGALIAEFDALARDVTDHIERYRIDLASDMLYHYIWHRFADEIIEASKPILADDDAEAIRSRQQALYAILAGFLKLLHPFMPFVTEAIWQALPQKDAELLMIAPWPVRAA